MTWIVDEQTGDTICRCGDSGVYKCTNLLIPYDGKCFYAISNPDNRKEIGHVEVLVNKGDTFVTFEIPNTLTDLCKVDADLPEKEYYFGIKYTYQDELTGQTKEETWILGNKNPEDDNILTVLPKTAEGD